MNNFENDLMRIEYDVITKQVNGKYMKFYKPLDAVVMMNMTKQQYIGYWVNLYHYDEQKMLEIERVCEEKFLNGLTPRGDMIDLILNSKDKTKDRAEALRLLGAREIVDKK